jgi:hypothetical protein
LYTYEFCHWIHPSHDFINWIKINENYSKLLSSGITFHYSQLIVILLWQFNTNNILFPTSIEINQGKHPGSTSLYPVQNPN